MLSLREDQGFLLITASGKLTRQDYAGFVPAFEAIAARDGKVPMLIDATGLEGWEAAALWEDLKFDISHQDSMGPMAIIGDQRWVEWGTWFAKPFFRSEVKFFQSGEIDHAHAWLLRARQRSKV